MTSNYYLEYNYIILNLIILIISCFLALNANKIGISLNLIDRPNSRKLHKGKIPTIGGLIIFICFGIKLILENYFFGIKDENLSFFLFSSILFFLGIIDDKYEINSYRSLKVIFLRKSIEF